MVNMKIFPSRVVILSMLMLFIGKANLTIVLDQNGYTNIVVAISENVPQPADGGTALINDLKALLTETSAILFQATGNRVYLKNIDILLPPAWTSSTALLTSKLSYQLADIRLTNEPASGSLPYTLHSGKCGVNGNFITLPPEYLEDIADNLKVQAKGLVQQWAQFRYGVFEEHGYPNDKLLPYFYRHPNGYDAVTSSNDTEIKGSLATLSGGNCVVNANGIISDQGNCRFVPTATEQTATTSLMSFHWLDTVIKFSEVGKHDRRPPHRQNRLCNSKSSGEVMANSPDFNNVIPNPNQNTAPVFRLLKNLMLPVVYVAMDTSSPANPNNTNQQAQNLLKRGVRNLFYTVSIYPETLAAYSTFENIDSGPEGSYLKEELPPRRIGDEYDNLISKIDNFVVSQTVLSRDVSAVIRDGEARLRQYKDTGGSILYLVTSTDSVTNDTVIETDLAERLMQNNIKLIVVETGLGTGKSLPRFSVLSQGSYYFIPTWDTPFFTPINNEVDAICRNGLKTQRRIITSRKNSITTSMPWSGSFSIDETVGTNTTVALSLPKEGIFTITLTNPNGDVVNLPNEPEVTNWNYPDSTVRVIWKKLADDTVKGRWSYQVVYDTTSCSACQPQPEIHLQIGSSIRSATSPALPKFQPWVSLTTSSGFVDLSEHPAVIQTRFEYANNNLGGLIVTAEIVLNSIVKASIPLFDTGLIDPDISKDGIYSGTFYPDANGNYKVNFYAVHSASAKEGGRLLSPDQNSYCCGSSLPTSTLNYFQFTAREAIAFEVRNVGTGTFPQDYLPMVSDIRASTYGIDQNLVYAELKWSVPSNTISQVVRYSENYEQLLDSFEGASQATVVYGSITEIEAGTAIAVYVSTPYTKGKSVYFVVETTAKNNQKTRSHIVWSEANPPEYPFTTPSPTTEAASTTPQTSTSSTTSATTSITEVTSTSAPIITSTMDSSIGMSTTEISTTSDVSVSVTSSSPTSTDPLTSTSDTSSTASTASSTTASTASTSTISSSTSASTTTTISTTTASTTTASTTTASTTTASTTTTPITTISTSSPPTSTESTASTAFSTTDSTSESSSPTEETTDSTSIIPPTEPPSGLTPAEIGYIVGGVVGGLVVIGAITGGIMFYKKKHGEGGGSLPPSTSNGRNGASGAPSERAEYSNTPYPPSTSYKSSTTPANANNGRQVERVEPAVQYDDNVGITFEDDDTCMTAM
ncbi:calcium-activated chloride channel regulator 1-like isoform X2 [Daphnia carinata]|uniref:calcium-activated chloride channel regulator 1-like isoform X2 n=1 Tax=Daphnia carinata TaxID=120202 RepID=UPI00257AA090|nr:calcium-activated chloride channel regulator 1-like isoform X2 [Daphnia carinata]